MIVSGLIFMYSVNIRICGQFEPLNHAQARDQTCPSGIETVLRKVSTAWSIPTRFWLLVICHNSAFLATNEIPSSLALCYYSVPQLHEHLNKNFLFEYLLLGCVFLGKSKCEFPNPKTYFAFFGQIQKRIMNP